MTRVLIADKNTAVGEMLAWVLQLQGYETFSAFSATEAFQMVEHNFPDIILLDLTLEPLSGIPFLDMLTLRGVRSNFQVIVMSTDELHWYDKQTGRRISAEGYLAKPFPLSALYNQIAQVATG
jgi:DNA-binding response OmpR family regulator